MNQPMTSYTAQWKTTVRIIADGLPIRKLAVSSALAIAQPSDRSITERWRWSQWVSQWASHQRTLRVVWISPQDDLQTNIRKTHVSNHQTI